MPDSPAELPRDVDALIALLVAERAERDAIAAERDRLASRNSRLETILAEMRRARFGRKSERLDDSQLDLALEDLETAFAAETGPGPSASATPRTRAAAPKRKPLPAHLPRLLEIIEPETKSCPCCNGVLHVIGEDVSERLDKVPARLRVIVTRRPRYGCRACGDGVVQAPAPARLVRGGLPTDGLVADVLVCKYGWHLPLYRQAQIYASEGIEIDRSMLADWVGLAAGELKPLHLRLIEILKTSPKLFADETRCPVLDPGRGKTKTGYLWAIARDDRPWGGPEPPAVAYRYAPGRSAEHAIELLAGFSGILQVDGYAAYGVAARKSASRGPLMLAFCWAHLRRQFYDLKGESDKALANEMLSRIAALYAIETEITGRSPEERRAVRQARTRPLADALYAHMNASLRRLSSGAPLAEALRYGLNHWEGLCRFLDDGRIEMDTNTVERAIRPLALTRKNALFAGHDLGADSWAIIASLIETCKLNAIEPRSYLAATLTKLVNLWPMSRIDELMPWAYPKPA